MAKKNKKLFKKSSLKLEALEQRQLLAGISGSGTEVTGNGAPTTGDTATDNGSTHFILASNGNKYDQVLLTGTSVSVTNDSGQITRVSFLDLQGDIVQAEFSGAGTFTVSMDAASAKAGIQPAGYNQTIVGGYEQGLATISVQGSDATSNVSIFSVGKGNAVNQALFDATHTGGNNTADVQRVTIVANPVNPNGSDFGGIRAGNAIFTDNNGLTGGTGGVVGITAANVQVQDTVVVGDITTTATGTATPTLVFGANSQFGSVTVAGGSLNEANGKAINDTGSYNFGLNLTAGTKSDGSTITAQAPTPGLAFTGNNPIQAAVKTFTLTTGVDTVVGSAGNDAINGQVGGTAGTDTFTPLDNIDGGAGNDTLTINDLAAAGSGLPGGVTIKNVETINLITAGVAKIDTSGAGVTGLTNLNVPNSTGADLITAGAGQAVSVTDTAGVVTLTGGSTQTVTTVGGVVLSKATGAVVATDTNQAAAVSSIDGGTTVNWTNTAKLAGAASGTVTIGAGAAPTGAITLGDTVVGDKTGSFAGGAVAVTGGTVDSITVVPSQPVNANGTGNFTLTEPTVTVTGTSTTTSVTVAGEVKAVTATTGVTGVAAVAGTTETSVVKFAALTGGQTLTLGGLTYTAPSNSQHNGATATEVATAFANQGKTTGLAAWTTGAVSGTSSDTVTFTSQTADTNVANLSASAGGTGAVTSFTETDGVAGTAKTTAVTALGGLAPSLITINDANLGASNATITSVTLSSFAAGANISSGALSTLSLTGTGGAVVITNTAAKTLDLTVNGVGAGAAAASVSNGTYTTINVHTVTADSTLGAITAGAATALSVDGTKALTLTSAPATLKTITVSGSAGLTVTSTLVGTSASDVNAAATSGAVTVTLDPTATTYEGGSGVDSVTVNGTPTKAIDGGAGTDVLTLNFAGGYAATAKVTNFETLGLGALANGAAAYDATGFTGLQNGAVAAAVTYSNVAAGVPLTLTATPGFGVTYTAKDATGAADATTITLKGGAGVDASTGVTASGIESVTVNSNGKDGNKLTLVDTALTGMTVTGGNTLTLSNAGNTSLTTVNAGSMTAALTYTTAGGVGETVTAGTGADLLTAGPTSASTQADVLIGGAGNDTLTSNSGLTTLTGGLGNDTFVVQAPGANVNTYTTIDAQSGDLIKLTDLGTETFNPNKVTLGSGTAVFQDYANAAVFGTAGVDAHTNANISWFQFNGDTYIVENMHDATNAGQPSFKNGTDLVVKITGLVDLSTAVTQLPGAGAPVIVIR